MASSLCKCHRPSTILPIVIYYRLIESSGLACTRTNIIVFKWVNIRVTCCKLPGNANAKILVVITTQHNHGEHVRECDRGNKNVYAVAPLAAIIISIALSFRTNVIATLSDFAKTEKTSNRFGCYTRSVER
jgi:hypothetical protein